MTNHIHLIVEAGNSLGDIGELMKRLAGRQTRHKISPIDSDAYLLQCCRYVELNPVKAKIVSRPQDYLWSSYRALIGEIKRPRLDLSACFLALGNDENKRAQRYREFVEDAASAEKEASFIRAAVDRNQLTGGSRFIDEIEARTGVRVEFRSRGRPKAIK